MAVDWDAPFWRNVHPEALSGCWLWHGSMLESGYGKFHKGARRVYAHRLAYELVVGPIPRGGVVMHTCDVPACVNPDHLKIGTQLDNMRDMTRKGRRVRGERHGCAKLDQATASRIRRSSGKQRDIAAEFGVSQRTVWRIKAGLAWGDL